MSGSYSSRLRGGGRGGGGLGATTVLAAKVALASAALAAAASLARMAVPLLKPGADAFLWKLYLFVTVHVIIFVIWKLSDNKHFHAQQHKDPWAPTPPILTERVILSSMKRKVEFTPAADVVPCEEFRVPPPVSRPLEAAIAARADEFRVPPPMSQPHLEAAASPVNDEFGSPGSCGGESCVTTESEEDAASAYVGVVNSRRNVAAVRDRAVLGRGHSLRPPQAMVATDGHLDGADHDDGGGDDDLDATWNAIMQKTSPPSGATLVAAAYSPRSVGGRGGAEQAVRGLHQQDPPLVRSAAINPQSPTFSDPNFHPIEKFLDVIYPLPRREHALPRQRLSPDAV